jgi:hypothetical protein
MKEKSIYFVITILLIPMIIFTTKQANAEGKKEDIYIQINLWSNELHLIKNNKIYVTYPISSGTDSTPTPIGIFKVTKKGTEWGGGFGSRWLGLNVPWGKYGIHGTNKPMLIGKCVSHGCIRMRNKDVEALFEMIPEGTTVYIDGPLTGKGKGAFIHLSVGSKGNLVQLVQERLKFAKLYNGKIDGIYGCNTEIAVRRFQKNNHLSVTGVVSENEYRLLGLLE